MSYNASDNNEQPTYTNSKDNSTEEKFDKSNATGIIDSYMGENHIDTIKYI